MKCQVCGEPFAVLEGYTLTGAGDPAHRRCLDMTTDDIKDRAASKLDRALHEAGVLPDGVRFSYAPQTTLPDTPEAREAARAFEIAFMGDGSDDEAA